MLETKCFAGRISIFSAIYCASSCTQLALTKKHSRMEELKQVFASHVDVQMFVNTYVPQIIKIDLLDNIVFVRASPLQSRHAVTCRHTCVQVHKIALDIVRMFCHVSFVSLVKASAVKKIRDNLLWGKPGFTTLAFKTTCGQPRVSHNMQHAAHLPSFCQANQSSPVHAPPAPSVLFLWVLDSRCSPWTCLEQS